MERSYSEMKAWLDEMPGSRFFGCHLCKGTDKWCVLDMDDEHGAVCERHGVVVPSGSASVTPNVARERLAEAARSADVASPTRRAC